MKTEKLSSCTEQNSGWCNSYTRLFTLGNPTHQNGRPQTPEWQTWKQLQRNYEQRCIRLVFFSSFLNQTLDHKNPRRVRRPTPTDLHPDQVIATLCTTLTWALPPLSVNSHLKTSFQPPWTEGKPHPLPGDVLQAGAGTDTVELSECKSQPTHSLVLIYSLLIWPQSQVKLSHYIEINPKYWHPIKGWGLLWSITSRNNLLSRASCISLLEEKQSEIQRKLPNHSWGGRHSTGHWVQTLLASARHLPNT